MRGVRNDTLSRAAEDHVEICALLKGKLEQYEQGNYVGGKCQTRSRKTKRLYESKSIGQAFLLKSWLEALI